MHARAAQLIAALNLVAHPEGGYFGEVYRSAARVRPLDDDRLERPALTTIFFLLAAGDVSRWHRVASDEVWHFYEGDPLELWSAPRGFADVARRLLGPAGDGVQPVHVVRAHDWQAARSTGAYTLVGCTVGPGFDFADFELIEPASAEADAVRRDHPALTRFI
jgi:uncharacterized protein